MCEVRSYVEGQNTLIFSFILILFSDQGMMQKDGLWMQELEKHLQVNQGNFQNI